MIVPKEHTLSMAQSAVKYSVELEELLREVQQKIEAHFGPTTVFEHGATYEDTTFGCGIDHAHLHVVPLPNNIALRVLAESALGEKFCIKRPSPTQPYLRIREPFDTAWYTLEPSLPPPRQFFRQLIWQSHLWEADSYDYDKAPCIEVVEMTVQILGGR